MPELSNPFCTTQKELEIERLVTAAEGCEVFNQRKAWIQEAIDKELALANERKQDQDDYHVRVFDRSARLRKLLTLQPCPNE